MEKQLAANLLAVARAYSEATGLELSTLGRMAAGHTPFFAGLEDPDTTFTVRKYDSVMAWFAKNWPEKVRWPRGIPRPTPEELAEATP